MPSLPAAFSALGNSTRFAIVERLLKDGEFAAGEFLKKGAMSPPAMSHHFKVLRQAGIVRQRIDKQRRMYSVRPEAVRAIGAWSLSYRHFWGGSLGRLEAALGKEGEGP